MTEGEIEVPIVLRC